ncbi:Indole-3-glycerol phosphate synthase / Phosphoribosylanthranilate isomerase [Liberibacter crescens BT-1]|uniref:Multifunctional fusion protein n=1 Tax=Liberibacter crescens (strain BT-1) TaxID=1215343 RepID=L0EY41_LIBCB|nr:bifunctional indole-3-glycerol-phosphate synthase TrpC/phosphoribosylanthranilate isomerase TrpF [Liberibacter crescens]AGA65301.1 Indole-3-glycerol phosphate synthase / Phosphoribosylanthranilate isomerase [Liberibacter crescens BT-1]AMC13233.1 indole-3-glycerol phosphate synthase [Liberibacter crescens]
MQDTVLAKIVADKYEWVSEYQRLKPLDSFRHQLQPSTRSFYHAVSGTRTAFILECKKASPYQGFIRDDFDPVAIAGVYRHYASAIAVLTDEKYFQGSFDYLPEVSRSVSQPVLCKDFIFNPWQIYFARLHQADAVLLMLSILDDDTYRALAAVAHSLNMGVLTEIISDEERERAIALGAKIVGINNRDLCDLSIDLNRTRTLGPRLPADVTVISESGIKSYRQLRELNHYANGFLIGSALMSEPDLTIAVRRVLLGENKVCGLTRAVDARAALEAGAIYGGLIFVPGSPRCVDIDTARTVMAGAALLYVGVFCDAPVEDVAAAASVLSLAAVQLHGDEDQSYIDALRHALPLECRIWKALDMCQALLPRDLTQVDRYVLDNGSGSGKPFNWSLLNGATLDNVILAGGLAADNCLAAAHIGCSGLDFNSGVESAPGIKDHHKLATVFQTLRAY